MTWASLFRPLYPEDQLIKMDALDQVENGADVRLEAVCNVLLTSAAAFEKDKLMQRMCIRKAGANL